MLEDAWWSIAVENILIFILRSIRWVLVAILRPNDHTALMVGVYFVLGLFWIVEGFFLLLLLVELSDIIRYTVIIEKFYDVDDLWFSYKYTR